MLFTQPGSSIQQMHERRPASVSKGPSEEAESSTSQDTVTDSPNPASTGRNKGDSEGDFLTIDPGLWPKRFTDREREVIIGKLATASQTDLKTIMPKDSEGKKFPEYLQFSKSANGREKQKRDWLTYSPSMDSLYCVPCMLFSQDDLRKTSTSALNSKEGYKTADLKWRRMYNKFPDHEASKAHKACYLKWKNLKYSLIEAKGIDSSLQKQIQMEVEKNKAILERILDVTFFGIKELTIQTDHGQFR